MAHRAKERFDLEDTHWQSGGFPIRGAASLATGSSRA